MNDPRKHHYVPKFLLAGFTRERTGDGELHVLDLKRRAVRVSTPAKEGHKRDHFRVEAEDPFVVERLFGQMLEDPAAALISEVVERRKLPDESGMDVILSLVANLATRTRAERKKMERLFADSVAMLENMTGSNYDIYRRQLEEAGEEATPEDYAQYQEYLRSDKRPRFSPGRTKLVLDELRLAADLFPLLCRRDWGLLVSEEPGVEFVCSDCPVILVDSAAHPFHGPGFGLASTTVFVPLWRHGMLIGKFGRCSPVTSLGRDEVASINTVVVSQAHEFVWSRRRRFVYRWCSDVLRDPDTLLKDLGRDDREED